VDVALPDPNSEPDTHISDTHSNVPDANADIPDAYAYSHI